MRGALLVTFAAQGACFATLISRVPALRDRFALDDLRLGVVLAVVPLLAGVGSLAAGRLAGTRPGGALPILRVAAPVVCLALPGVAMAPGIPALLAALAVFALALGAVDATMNAHGVSLERRAGRSLMSGFHAAYSLGGILGSIAAAAGVPLTAMGVAGALTCLAAGRTGPSHATAPPGSAGPRTGLTAAHRTAEPRPARPPGRWRRVAVAGAVTTLLFLVDSAVANWGATYLRSELAAPGHLAALVYGTYSAAALAGRTLGDLVVDRFGPVPVVAAGGLLGQAGLLGVVLAGTPAPALAGFAVAGAGLSVVAPQAFAAAGRAAGADGAAAAVARVNTCAYAGFVLGPPIIGTVAAVTSIRGGFLAALLLTAVLTVGARWFR